MKKIERASGTGKRRSIVVSFLAVILVLFGGYFGNSVIDKPEEEKYQQDQEIEKTIQDSDNIVTYHFRSEKLWQQHYEKHGIEMGFESPEDYLLAANKVIENENVLHKLEEEDGDDVYYVEETNEFVIVSTDGYLRTYFNPSDGIQYYNRQ